MTRLLTYFYAIIYIFYFQVREWAGMLINYEVVSWFHEMQRSGVIGSEVNWPTEATLAKHMLDFKLTGLVQHDSGIGSLAGTAAGAFLMFYFRKRYDLILH